MRAIFIAAALLLCASSVRAQGQSMPWDDDENMSGQTMPRGNVAVGGPLRIRTSRPDCLLSAGFPVLRALIEPPDTISSVLVHFRPEGYALWYEVPMKRSGEGFVAVLPRPRPSAQRVRFFVEAFPLDGRPVRGKELSATVVEERAQCGGTPAETVERAAIGVRVPKGAPALPPVPPGFEPVGTVSLNPPVQKGRKAPLLVAGGFAGALGALFAQGGAGTPTPANPRLVNQVEFLDSSPPPSSHISISSGAQLMMRVRIRLALGLGAGAAFVRVTLLDTFSATPCATLQVPIGFVLPPGASQEVLVSGALTQPRVCQPTNILRLEVVANGAVVAGTGAGGQPDFPAAYFIDP